jgi:TonB family protein
MYSALLLVALVVPQSAAPRQPPRDPAVTPGIVADGAAREAQLTRQIAAAPGAVGPYLELAKLQEARSAAAEAEATLMRARTAAPADKQVLIALAQFHNRRGQFEKTVAMLEAAAQLNPSDPQGFQILATFYWEKAYKDKSLLPAEQYTYVTQGIAATDRALEVKPDYVEALTYKNLLLRMRANLESDPALKQQLIAEADALRNRAIELNRTRAGITGSGNTVSLHAGPPPPPPPPAPGSDGMAPLRVGGNIRTPSKIKDVRPQYPAEAQAAGIQGVVIIEATIDRAGRVSDAKVLRSIPVLDEAALDAVRQWEFVPTLLNGAPVPVIMTVTVNFSMQ